MFPNRRLATGRSIDQSGPIRHLGTSRQTRARALSFYGLAKAYYDYDHDPSLRAAILFGHGENFSRGIDVDAFKPLAKTGKPFALDSGMVDPFGKFQRLSKPLIVVVHGDTWNMGHELHLVADIRIASADVRFGQDENTHGRFPGGGSTIRFPREAGWGNAMRYMLTGDHWGAEEAFRMGAIQEIAPDPRRALETASPSLRKSRRALLSGSRRLWPRRICPSMTPRRLRSRSWRSNTQRFIAPKILSKAVRRKPKVGHLSTAAARAASLCLVHARHWCNDCA
jgi:enoyl-CoA hydratase/carnithine racemase